MFFAAFGGMVDAKPSIVHKHLENRKHEQENEQEEQMKHGHVEHIEIV